MVKQMKDAFDPKVQTAFRIRKSMKERLRLMAEHKDTSVNSVVVDALHEYLNQFDWDKISAAAGKPA